MNSKVKITSEKQDRKKIWQTKTGVIGIPKRQSKPCVKSAWLVGIR